MEMSQNMTASMNPLGGMGMDIGKVINAQGPRSRRPPPSSIANPKKKRRITAKASRSAKVPMVQDLLPPELTGHGDTVIVSNPFDDAPPKMSQGTFMHVGGQHIQSQRFDSPGYRGMGTITPMMTSMGPTIPQNVGNMRPFGNYTNQMNQMGVNSPMDTNFSNSTNNMGQNLPNGLIMNNHMKMAEMENYGIRGPPAVGNSNIFNNHTMNGPLMNNNDIRATQNRPLNGPPVLPNNLNNSQSHNGSQFHSNSISNEIGIVGRLMNAKMNISHKNQRGPSKETMTPFPNKKSVASFTGNPMSLSGSVPHSNLKKALDMGPKSYLGEKTYPADKPMIFNAQNPHAPPIYPCGICHKEVKDNDQGVICESGCNFWFHRSCLGLSEAAFQLLTREIYAEWVCDKCLRSKDIPVVKFKQ